MPNVLVRDVEPDVLQVLKSRAETNGRSLNSELQTILCAAAGRKVHNAKNAAAKIRRGLEGRKHTDSAQLLAEDRRR
jgi:plasmid stability protein